VKSGITITPRHVLQSSQICIHLPMYCANQLSIMSKEYPTVLVHSWIIREHVFAGNSKAH